MAWLALVVVVGWIVLFVINEIVETFTARTPDPAEEADASTLRAGVAEAKRLKIANLSLFLLEHSHHLAGPEVRQRDFPGTPEWLKILREVFVVHSAQDQIVVRLNQTELVIRFGAGRRTDWSTLVGKLTIDSNSQRVFTASIDERYESLTRGNSLNITCYVSGDWTTLLAGLAHRVIAVGEER